MTPGSAATKRWRKKYPEKARALARASRARWRVRYPEKVKTNNDKYNSVVYTNRWNERHPVQAAEIKRDGHRREKARLRNYAAPPRERECPPRPENCECCGAPIEAKKLRLDHNHKTGAFMGWCCDACNTLGDNIERLKARIKYLRRQHLWAG